MVAVVEETVGVISRANRTAHAMVRAAMIMNQVQLRTIEFFTVRPPHLLCQGHTKNDGCLGFKSCRRGQVVSGFLGKRNRRFEAAHCPENPREQSVVG